MQILKSRGIKWLAQCYRAIRRCPNLDSNPSLFYTKLRAHCIRQLDVRDNIRSTCFINDKVLHKYPVALETILIWLIQKSKPRGVFPDRLIQLAFLSHYHVLHIFFLNYVWERDRKGKKEFSSSDLFPKCPQRAGAKAKAGTKSQSPMEAAATQPLSHHCCLSGSVMAGSWNLELQPGLKPRHSDVERESLNWHHKRLIPWIFCFLSVSSHLGACPFLFEPYTSTLDASVPQP